MKNLIVFHTDQLRKDHLGCYGNSVAQTPNLDALAKRGVIFQNHYASNPMCSPSRASFITGRHCQAHRLIDNGISLPKSEITLPQALAERGYRTHSIGKLHLTPMGSPVEYGHEESHPMWASGALDDWNGPYYGFQTLELTLGHGDGSYVAGGHYGRWVRESFPDLAAKIPDFLAGISQFGLSNLPLEAQHSTWAADRAIDFVGNQGKDSPFFLFLGFPDPHHPFVCPDPYYTRFSQCDFPAPHRREGENDAKPAHYREAMQRQQFPSDGGAHRPLGLADSDWQVIRAATYGMTSLIDASVGRVLQAVRDAGMEDNTTFAFTSDHGDLMGDHWFLYKGPVPCRSLLNVPFIVADPNIAPRETDSVMSNVDAMPTLLDLVGVESPDCVQGRSMVDVMKGGECDDEHVALTSGWSKDSPGFYHHTIYNRKWRISYFPYQDDGELYDLEKDPYEFENLYHKPEHRAVRDEMMHRLLREVGRAEPPNLPVVAKW